MGPSPDPAPGDLAPRREAYAAIGAAEGLDAGLAAATTGAKNHSRELLRLGRHRELRATADVNVTPRTR